MADDKTLPPPPSDSERPIQVPHYPSKRWIGRVADSCTVDESEWRWYILTHPSVARWVVNGSTGPAGDGQPYVRFAEINERPTVARRLHVLRPYVRFRYGLELEPAKNGPAVRLLDGVCTNLLPSNRAFKPASQSDKSTKGRRVYWRDEWAVRVRVEAVLDGRDPDEAWMEALLASQKERVKRAEEKVELARERLKSAQKALDSEVGKLRKLTERLARTGGLAR